MTQQTDPTATNEEREESREADQFPEDRSIFHKVLFWAGPILASFHVATVIVGFFSFGAVARWIINQWFPFTRWVWTQAAAWLRQYVEFPILSDIEKDALTTLVFFTPLGLWAMLSGSKDSRNKDYWLAGCITGLLFLYIVGYDLFSHVFYRDWSIQAIEGAFPFFYNMFRFFYGIPEWIIGKSSDEFLAIDYVYIFICIIFTFFIPFLAIKMLDLKTGIGFIIVFLSLTPLMLFTSSVLLMALLLPAALALVVFTNFSSVGWISTICFLLVLVLSFSAVFRSPYRLSLALGSLAAFVISGLMFELVTWLVQFVESAPS